MSPIPRRYAPAALLPLLAGVILLPALLDASVVRYATVEELTEGASAVIRGRVAKVETRRVDEGRRVVTLVTLRPTTVFKGPADEAVQVVIDGGLDGEIGQRVHGLPTLAPDDEVLLFLEAHPAPSPPGVPPRFTLASMGLGAFRIEADQALRQVEGLKIVTGPLHDPVPLPAHERALPVADLEARIRAILDAPPPVEPERP